VETCLRLELVKVGCIRLELVAVGWVDRDWKYEGGVCCRRKN
jgi:hypothetical protein